MLGIVLCHKNLATELVTTARAVIGHRDDLYPFSNDRITADQLIKELEEFFAEKKPQKAVLIMVDLRGGNCWAVARRFARNHPQCHIISGVNLPMLFSFLTKKDNLPMPELLKILEEDAHRGIVLEKE